MAEIEGRLVPEPSHEEIEACAYSIWEQHGRPHGTDVENWFEAAAIVHRGKHLYDVILTAPGQKKVQIVREIRAATGLDLKTVKSLVEKTPQPIREALAKEDAEALVSTLQAAGASLEIRPTV